MYTMTTTNGMVSVIIPSRNEQFLYKTVKDLLAKAKGPIEVIVVLDGYWTPPEEIISDKRVVYLHHGAPRGMRACINEGANIAHGEYLMKSDGHCMYDEGFDEKLKAGVPEYVKRLELDEKWMEYEGGDNWIVIPRRHRLDAENWVLQEVGKPPVDYEYLSSFDDLGVKGNVWNERTKERMDKLEYMIDENMSFQGSCWFMTRHHYLDRLGGMSEVGYGTFVREAQEIGLKTWLGGGRVYINKHTWYAHLHKGKTYGRGYFLDKLKMIEGNKYCDDFWYNNRWEGAKYDLAWLIERFSPVPTWTPELIDKVRRK